MSLLSLCPERSYGSDGVFQILTVPSRLAEESHSPSGLKATLSTQLVWPCSVRLSLVPTFQTRTIRMRTERYLKYGPVVVPQRRAYRLARGSVTDFHDKTRELLAGSQVLII